LQTEELCQTGGYVIFNYKTTNSKRISSKSTTRETRDGFSEPFNHGRFQIPDGCEALWTVIEAKRQYYSSWSK
jgi:hypothetical protein